MREQLTPAMRNASAVAMELREMYVLCVPIEEEARERNNRKLQTTRISPTNMKISFSLLKILMLYKNINSHTIINKK